MVGRHDLRLLSGRPVDEEHTRLILRRRSTGAMFWRGRMASAGGASTSPRRCSSSGLISHRSWCRRRRAVSTSCGRSDASACRTPQARSCWSCRLTAASVPRAGRSAAAYACPSPNSRLRQHAAGSAPFGLRLFLLDSRDPLALARGCDLSSFAGKRRVTSAGRHTTRANRLEVRLRQRVHAEELLLIQRRALTPRFGAQRTRRVPRICQRVPRLPCLPAA